MDDLTLNIDYHVKRLVLIALKKYASRNDQARALGRTVRWLQKYIEKHKI